LSFLYNDCVRIKRRGNTDTDPYSYGYANFNPKAHSYAQGHSDTKTSPDAVTPE